jgi:hypothetical protein
MCHDDAGSHPGDVRQICTGMKYQLDCSGDDYFHTLAGSSTSSGRSCSVASQLRWAGRHHLRLNSPCGFAASFFSLAGSFCVALSLLPARSCVDRLDQQLMSLSSDFWVLML